MQEESLPHQKPLIEGMAVKTKPIGRLAHS